MIYPELTEVKSITAHLKKRQRNYKGLHMRREKDLQGVINGNVYLSSRRKNQCAI